MSRFGFVRECPRFVGREYVDAVRNAEFHPPRRAAHLGSHVVHRFI